MKLKKPYQDLTGSKYGRLTVMKLLESEAGANIPTKYICKCECGKVVTVRAYNLKSGNTLSCGCLQKELAADHHRTHGATKSRLHNTWNHMKQRCHNASDRAFKYYGARGIKVCDEWKDDFTAFFDWAMSHGYEEHLTIDRIDVNGNYCPENCRWITIQEQQRNKRDNVRVVFNGETRTVGEWALKFGCRSQAVYREILKREGRVQGEDYQ